MSSSFFGHPLSKVDQAENLGMAVDHTGDGGENRSMCEMRCIAWKPGRVCAHVIRWRNRANAWLESSLIEVYAHVRIERRESAGLIRKRGGC